MKRAAGAWGLHMQANLRPLSNPLHLHPIRARYRSTGVLDRPALLELSPSHDSELQPPYRAPEGQVASSSKRQWNKRETGSSEALAEQENLDRLSQTAIISTAHPVSGPTPARKHHTRKRSLENLSEEARAQLDHLEALLAHKQVDLRGLFPTLLSIPTSHLTTKHLAAALVKSADPASLLRITPLVLDVCNRASLRSTSFLLAAILEKYGHNRMIAAVPFIFDYFLTRAAREWATQPRPNDLAWAYHRVLGSLWRFTTDNLIAPNRKDRLPPSIQTAVYRVAKDIVDRLDALPGPSSRDQAPAILPRTRELLLSRHYTSPALRDLIVGHITSRGLEMTDSEWHLCTASAMRERRPQLVDQYLQEKALGLPHPTPVATTTPGDSRPFSTPTIPPPTTPTTPTTPMARPGSSSVEGTLREAEPPPPSLEVTNDEYLGYEAVIKASATSDFAETTSTLQHFLISKPVAPPHLAYPTFDHVSHTTRAFSTDQSKTSVRTRSAAYAWSTLFHKLSQQLHVSVEDIRILFDSLSPELILKETITPLLKALVVRGEHQLAWDLWLDLDALAVRDPPAQRGKWVDRVLLSVVTQLCYAVQGLPAAVGLVDTWARRLSGAHDPSRPVVLDAWNVNTLLHLCRLEKSPSVALRLWTAAHPRWGVKLDEISLNILMDVSRVAQPKAGFSEETRGLFGRVFGEHRRAATDWSDYDDSGFAKGPTSVLLDPPQYTNAAQTLPPQRAKALFEEILLGNWPHLRHVISPLELHREPLNLVYSWSSPVSSPRSPEPPAVDAKYTHIIPSATSFHSYIVLLATSNCASEIPIAFAWAKEIGVVPHWDTMRSGLFTVLETQGPRRWIKGWSEGGGTRLVADVDILMRWFRDWLDPEGRGGIVPTEADVGAFRERCYDILEPERVQKWRQGQ